MSKPVTYTDFPSLQLVRRGKVRDVYSVEGGLLLVASDRISAFDVVMEQPIPGKGAILTGISELWFKHTTHIVRNHLLSTNVADFPAEAAPYAETLEGRTMYVRSTQPLPIECVVRGYIAGSAWKEYVTNGTACGIPLPAGLVQSSQLPEPIFTPATKAEEGHDENISFERAAEILGEEVAVKVRDISLALYSFAHTIAQRAGILIADTKFEFGLTPEGELILIDEALTPDSSRFWLASAYAPGAEQQNFDKQALRDYLERQPWNKQYPPPVLSPEIIATTYQKYNEALQAIQHAFATSL
jgi:phosphoribosylaminoimidazole-succinocarboxamide synthase